MEEKTYLTVLSHIKKMIQTGQLAVGDRLPTERTLSSELSISRNTVRDAMRMLESMGIVESRHGSGNYLSAHIDRYLSESLQFLLLLSQLSYLEINQLRRAVELEACRLALDVRSARQLEELRIILKRMENAPPDQRAFSDQQFHNAILKASGNHLLVLISDALSEVCGSLISELSVALSAEKAKELQDMHRKLLTAFVNRSRKDSLDAVNRHYDITDQILVQWEKENNQNEIC